MRRSAAILLLSVLLWVEPASTQVAPASAQKKHSLTVRIHTGVTHPLTPADVKVILDKASDILNSDDNRNCNVKFELEGPIQPFTSAPITDDRTLEAVHQVPADVKIVPSIAFCPVGSPPPSHVLGCSFRPADQRHRTMIVSTLMVGPVGPTGGRHRNLWAHEFGHTTGLPHRDDVNDLVLMTQNEIFPFHTHINKNECDHFRAGPPSRR